MLSIKRQSVTQVTYIKRDKYGNVKIKTIGWSAKREVFVIKGPVTFVSVTYQRKTAPRSGKKKQGNGRRTLREIIRRGLRAI